MTRDEQYLGDGVYASFDGYQIWLRTEREGRQERIALEPEVWWSLRTFVEQLTKDRVEQEAAS